MHTEHFIETTNHLVTAQDLADALNRLRPADPMWEEGGFRVSGRWLEIDPDASDRLAAHLLGCDLEEARRRNDEEARWFVAGGVGVVYSRRYGWRPAPPGPPPPTPEIEAAPAEPNGATANLELDPVEAP